MSYYEAIKSVVTNKKIHLFILFKEDLRLILCEVTSESFITAKALPARINEGFRFFRRDFFRQLELLSSNKEKMMFVTKVMGSLTSLLLGLMYHTNLRRNNFTRLALRSIVFYTTRLYFIRFLEEVEKEMSSKDEAEGVFFLKELLLNQNYIPAFFLFENDSIDIVENLKKYIMTGAL
jgi:hypothetical protein